MKGVSWRLPLKLGLSLVLLLYLFSKTDLEPLWGSLRQAHWPCLLLGLGLVLSGQVMSAFKWKLLLKALGIERPFGLLGFVVPRFYYFIFVPLSALLSSLPISFSGLGVREGSYVYFLKMVQVPHPQALSFGLLWLSILLASGLIGGMIYLGGTRISAALAARKTD